MSSANPSSTPKAVAMPSANPPPAPKPVTTPSASVPAASKPVITPSASLPAAPKSVPSANLPAAPKPVAMPSANPPAAHKPITTPSANPSSSPKMTMPSADPSSPKAIAAPPSTPRSHRARATPRTPGSGRSLVPAMVCSTDPAKYAIIKIHTAKCSQCDLRNKIDMRRCPGCTWQICTPCFDEHIAKGKTFDHGQKSPVLTTPVRRRTLANHVGPITPRSTPAKGQEVDAKPKYEPMSPEVAIKQETPKTGSEKKRARDRNVKPTKSFRELSEEYSDDENFEPESSLSPTLKPSRKRRKVSAPDDKSKTPTKRVAERYATASSPLASKDGRNSRDIPAAEAIASSTDELGGVNIGRGVYLEPLLGRQRPAMTDPIIRIPDSVKRNFAPRLTVEQIEKRIQDKEPTTEPSDTANTMRESTTEPSDMANTIRESTTMASDTANSIHELVASEVNKVGHDTELKAECIGDFVKLVVSKIALCIHLEQEEEDALLPMVKMGAKGWATRFYGELGKFLQDKTSTGLKMEMGALNSHQKTRLLTSLGDSAIAALEGYIFVAGSEARSAGPAGVAPPPSSPGHAATSSPPEVVVVSPSDGSMASAAGSRNQ